MKTLEKTYDAIARERDAARKQPREWLKFFLPFLKRNWVVLDAGCGNANNAIEIARRVKRVACLDFSKETLECARENARAAKLERKIELIKADITKMPFRNAEFDAAFYVAVLHHLRSGREQNAAFKEMNRVLKPRGLVFAQYWNKTQPRFAKIKGKSALVPGAAWGGKRFKRYYYFFDEKEIRALARAHGFRVSELFYEKNGVKTVRKGAWNVCFILEKIKSA
ncbi:class I SAM-dependent methyltransferase [Candidatus Micrarchaeota archaeon]|nr:class I SAM-dependent methyltransferase [Candidatus Micrarchaeota archaeon]